MFLERNSSQNLKSYLKEKKKAPQADGESGPISNCVWRKQEECRPCNKLQAKWEMKKDPLMPHKESQEHLLLPLQ